MNDKQARARISKEAKYWKWIEESTNSFCKHKLYMVYKRKSLLRWDGNRKERGNPKERICKGSETTKETKGCYEQICRWIH